MKKRNLGVLAVVFTTLTVALGGCGKTVSTGTGDKAETTSQITVAIPQDIDSLDPHTALAAGTREVLFNMYEGLVKPDENGDLLPAVASDVTISEDATTYSFTLRDGVKFHDGSTVTAEDVKYSLDRCAGAGGGDPLVAAFSAIKSVDIVDDTHIDIVLNDPDSEFLPELTVAIIPASNKDIEGNPIGTGPYSFVSRTPQESVVMKAFDDYYDEAGKAAIKDLVFKIIPDNDVIVQSFKSGAVDMFARLTIEMKEELEKEEGIEISEGTMNLVQALYLNNKKDPFDDVRVRQALCYATDRQMIMDFVTAGEGTAIGSSMFPSFGKYYMPELADVYKTDIDKAKELLAEAGYPDGFTFTITVPSNYVQHVDTAQVLAEQFKEIGVTAEISTIEWNSWLSDVYSGRDYEATVIGVDASTLSASALLSRFRSDAGNNFVNFSSDAYDAAFKKASEAIDDDVKTEAYKECERILTEEAANVYIMDMPEYVALRSTFTGYTFYPLYAQNIAKIRPADR